MKAAKLILILSLTACTASHTALLATGLSAPTNGIYLAVVGNADRGPTAGETVAAEQRLIWMPFCDAGHVVLWYPLDPAYLVKLRMFDDRGREARRTALGARYGSKFDQLRGYKTTRLQPIRAWGPFTQNPGLGGGHPLPAPDQLFKLKEGIYTLEIQMQMFRHVASTNVNDWSTNLLRFPPVKIRVEKARDW